VRVCVLGCRRTCLLHNKGHGEKLNNQQMIRNLLIRYRETTNPDICCTFPWCSPIPDSAKRVKSVAATTLL